jgi:hypothetical protein
LSRVQGAERFALEPSFEFEEWAQRLNEVSRCSVRRCGWCCKGRGALLARLCLTEQGSWCVACILMVEARRIALDRSVT